MLTFLRDIKVGETVSLVALGGGRGVEASQTGEEGEGWGRTPVRMRLFRCPLLGAVFFGTGEQETREPHYDGRAPRGCAGDCPAGTGQCRPHS